MDYLIGGILHQERHIDPEVGEKSPQLCELVMVIWHIVRAVNCPSPDNRGCIVIFDCTTSCVIH